MFGEPWLYGLGGTPFGSPNPPVCTASRGFFNVGIAELPIDIGVLSANTGLTAGASGFGVSFFAVAGFAIGEAKTGVMIFGFGGSMGAGGNSFATTGCFTATGLGAGRGCGFHGTTGGASTGVIQ
jgi:hypothetical protein